MDNDDVANDIGPLPEQRLPIELIALISSFLVDTSSFHTLAKLNQASHLVQTESIRHLYSTTIYKSTPSWQHTVGCGIPRGWAHTRNLLLNDTTHALLEQHLKFMVHLKLIDEPCICNAFPKLELLAVTDVQGFTRLELSKSISLAGIMERLDVNSHTQRSFYGTMYRQRRPPGSVRSRSTGKETIVGLDFRDRAYLLPDDGSDVLGAVGHAIPKFPKFRFEASGPPPEDREAAISGLVQFLKCYQRAQRYHLNAVETVLRIRIPAEWLELFARALRKGRALIRNVNLNLTTLNALECFEKHFTDLAEIYSANRVTWSSRPTHMPLVLTLIGLASVVPAFFGAPVTAAVVEADSRAQACTDAHVSYESLLLFGQWSEDDDNNNGPRSEAGCTGVIFRTTRGHGQTTQRELLFNKTFASREAQEAV